MEDALFLAWLHDRLVHVYGVEPNTDFLSKLRAIIANTPKNQRTPNAGPSVAWLAKFQAGEVED